MTRYAELQVTTNFSFLSGASHPEELVETAAALGLRAVAITDRNSLAGVVRAHVAAEKAGLRLLVGARVGLVSGRSVLCFPADRAAYGRLARLLTEGNRRAAKGACELMPEDLLAHGDGELVVALPPDEGRAHRLADPAFRRWLEELKSHFGDRCYLAAYHLYRGDDKARIEALAELARRVKVPLVATNDVHAHAPTRRPLQDVLTCVREGTTIAQAGFRLAANAERHLKPPAEIERLFTGHAHAVARTVEIAERSTFSLEDLRYEYPDETGANGAEPEARLEALVEEGLGARYPRGAPVGVRTLVERELRLIAELRYAPYFLTVYDIVRFAKSRGILCQGRGSAANSAVCYVLGITAVDPDKIDLLFERFVSAERGEPPDIDVDFEHERREEVIQYIYAKYGRDRAGLTATTITYRGKSAIRDVGKAMGLSLDVVAALAQTCAGRWRDDAYPDEDLRALGLDPSEKTLSHAVRLARELTGFPRHLSQHVGGFVITRGPLSEVVPITNAAMEGRTVIEWNKDDLDALGILKIDVLGLGMLTCLKKGFELLARHHGRSLDLASLPSEDPKVYDMLCEADSIGVFQVESRAQMTMLPRLKPRSFYDLVIEVAIVRPGPIQGDMVHPYLRRRNGEEPVTYPSPELEKVLKKTLGVPLFQEQAMRIAVIAAGFSPGEADALRRAMAGWRRPGLIDRFRVKLVEGMVRGGYERAFAERCFHQIQGFGEYGFPESHAASFALLVYASAWLKRHYPEAFACALINSQPMGFYAPAQIVRDAREHGVEVRPVDVNHSRWDCTLEPVGRGVVALRLGFRLVKGLGEADAARLVAARGAGYASVADLRRRSGLAPAALELLAKADAHRSLGLARREALWAVKGLEPEPLPLFAALDRPEAAVALPSLSPGEEVVEDYAALRLTLRRHPLAFLREGLERDGFVPAEALARLSTGRRVSVAGLAIIRQRPATARGTIFATIEDETGVANLVVRPNTFERFRRPLLTAGLLAATGRIERQGLVIHVLVERLSDLTHRLRALVPAPPEPLAPRAPADPPALDVVSRDFR